MDQQKNNISCLTALIEFTLAIFYQYHVPDGTEGIQPLKRRCYSGGYIWNQFDKIGSLVMEKIGRLSSFQIYFTNF